MTNTKQTITQTVHRFKLAIPSEDAVQAETTIQLPATAEITAVNYYRQGVEIYALLCPAHKAEERKFRVVRTGVEVPHQGYAKFRGTVVFPGASALHVFELL